MKIILQSKLSKASLKLAQKWSCKKYTWQIYIFYFFCLIGLFALVEAIWGIFLKDASDPQYYFYLVVAILCFSLKALSDWLTIQILQKEGDEVEWVITRESIAKKSKTKIVDYFWSGIDEALITPDGLLIYPQKNQIYLWVPKEDFQNTQEFNIVKNIILEKVKSREVC